MYGAVNAQSFTDRYLRDADIQSLIAKMRIVEDAQFTAHYPREFNCRMQVRTRDGQSFVAAVAHPKGHPRNPLTDAEVDAKFHALAAEVLSLHEREAALQQLWTFDTAPSLHQLLDCLIIAADC